VSGVGGIGRALEAVVSLLFDAVAGLIAGAAVLVVITALQRLWAARVR